MYEPDAAPAAAKSASPSRRERRKIETRERIFEAALNLLCERDFDSVTIEMITEAADAGKGTFFNYFKNKEELIVAYFDFVRLQLLESLRLSPALLEAPAAFAPESSPHGPIWQQFMNTAHRIAVIDGRSHRLARTLMSLSLTNDAVRRAGRKIGEDVHQSAVALVRLGQQTGEFRSDYDAQALSHFLGNVYSSTLFEWAQCEDDEPLEAAMRRSFALVWEAIRRQNSGR